MTKREKRKTTAKGQAYGYLVQVVRVLWHLLHASPGDVVAFEELGDVTIESNTGIVAEEDKSGLAHNPIADGSPALWKTFANWADSRRTGDLPPGSKYVLYVAQAHKGNIVQQLSDCRSPTEAQALVEKLRIELKPAKKRAKKGSGSEPEAQKTDASSKGSALQAQIDRLFAHSDSLIASIVVDFTLERANGTTVEDVKLVISRSADDEHVKDIAENLLGWVKSQIMARIDSHVPVRIPYDDFRKQRLAVTKRITGGLTAFPESDTVPTQEEISNELVDRLYVRQLQLLGMEDEDIHRNIGDFLRASAMRTNWSEAGLLDMPSYKKYEEELVSRWRMRRMSAQSNMAEKSAIARGVQILVTCLQEEARLHSIVVPQDFLRGSFHAIANEPRIGWHPDWEQLLGIKAKA